VVVAVTSPTATAADTPATPPPSPAPEPEVQLSEADAATLRELEQRLESLKGVDLFTVLGVGQDANGGQVKMAYFKLARSLHPDTVPQGAPPQILKLKSDLFARVGEAYRRLADDNARAAYLQELKSGTADQEKVDVQKLFLAEELFQKGSIMVKARKFADAIKMLTDAITANPDDAEFYAWRAAARFYAGADKRASYAEALKDVEAALQRNPKCAQACYFHGSMLKLLGDNAGALKLFKKTLEFNKDHVDAQRDVRLLEGAKK
jgi:curved DNA-binding protein CbpA